MSAVQAFAKENLAWGPAELASITEQGTTIINSVLPSLGVVPNSASDDKSATSSEVKVSAAKKDSQLVDITDVRDWKSTIPLSDGVSAVTDLATFEESEAKL